MSDERKLDLGMVVYNRTHGLGRITQVRERAGVTYYFVSFERSGFWMLANELKAESIEVKPV